MNRAGRARSESMLRPTGIGGVGAAFVLTLAGLRVLDMTPRDEPEAAS